MIISYICQKAIMIKENQESFASTPPICLSILSTCVSQPYAYGHLTVDPQIRSKTCHDPGWSMDVHGAWGWSSSPALGPFTTATGLLGSALVWAVARWWHRLALIWELDRAWWMNFFTSLVERFTLEKCLCSMAVVRSLICRWGVGALKTFWRSQLPHRTRGTTECNDHPYMSRQRWNNMKIYSASWTCPLCAVRWDACVLFAWSYLYPCSFSKIPTCEKWWIPIKTTVFSSVGISQ